MVAHSLRKLYLDKWQPEKLMRLLGNEKVYEQIVRGDAATDILKSANEDVSKFRERREKYLIYK